MNPFAWRRRPTRHFGEQWVPFAEMHLKSSRGRWRAFSVQVDTGAVISLLTRSTAEFLGVDLNAGEPIKLVGVGGASRRYFVHRLPAKIADLPEFSLRIAFCESEDVPNLLGRLDVLERFQIDFDSSLEETRITQPWLDEDDRRIWRHFVDVETVILAKWKEHPLPRRVDEAARRFVRRADQLVAAAAGLLKLHRGCELPLLIRSLFELSVQFEYLMQDPEPRAKLYLEYEHITKHRTEQAWLNLPGLIGDSLRASPQRAAGEQRNRVAYDQVRSQYEIKSKRGKVRSHWYSGNLKHLAEQVDRVDEYDAVYSLYSAWAHGDPWTARGKPLAHDGPWHTLKYWARLLILVADAKKIVLAGEAYESLQVLAKGMTQA